jgi:vacuolar-type H+-ATPase subunit I/STV1
MATYGGSSGGDVELQALLDDSPAPRARTSVAAMTALVCGLGAVLTAPFSILLGVAMLLGLAAMFIGMVGLVTTHRPDVAGSALTAFGICLGALAIALIGVRYLGLDSAFGDSVVPWIAEHLHQWNTRLPQPP